MNQSAITELTLDIRNLLGGFSRGKINKSEAETACNLLEERYASIRQGISTGESCNIIDGLCFHHNVENFCIFTGVYQISGKNVVNLSKYGNTNISEKISSILCQKRISFEKDCYTSISPDEEPSLKNTLHIYSFKTNNEVHFAIASLSSSNYFSSARFINFGNFFNTLFPPERVFHGRVIDTFVSIKSYIESNLDKTALSAHIWYFYDLDFIFSHTGSRMLFDVSSEIETQISSKCKNQFPKYTISMKEYVVISSGLDPVQNPHDFFYNGIPLPTQYMMVPLDGPDIFNKFYNEFFSITGSSNK